MSTTTRNLVLLLIYSDSALTLIASSDHFYFLKIVSSMSLSLVSYFGSLIQYFIKSPVIVLLYLNIVCFMQLFDIG